MVTLFQIVGSLGLFLFGMKLMSEGLQKLSGEKLRSIMKSMTGNRVKGVLSGVIVTSTIQSSSATTVMVVGFVNAGLLKLREAIGVIMGANLGTTITAWIVALCGFKFSMSSIALPLVGIGVALSFFRRANLKNTGEFLIGLGILFVGLQFLKDSVPDISKNPELFEWIQSYTQYGFGSVLIFLAFGVILTLVVQSSSVAMAITMTMMAKGWIGFELSAAIVLGENIGTTITAIIASAAGNRNAKRAAVTHLAFNVIGVIWMLCVFNYFLEFVSYLAANFDVILNWFSIQKKGMLADDNLIKLALFHTTFNATNILLLIGFVPMLEKLAKFLIKITKDEDIKQNPLMRLEYLSNNFSEIGELCLFEGQKEVVDLAEMSERMFSGFVDIFQKTNEDLSQKVNELRELEKDCDKLAYALTQFFVQCTAHELSEKSTKLVVKNMTIIAELEDLSDCCFRLLTMAKKRYRKQSNYQMLDVPAFIEFCNEILNFLTFTKKMLEQQSISKESLDAAKQMREKLNLIRKMIRREAVSTMEAKGSVTRGGVLFIEILSQCEKVSAHAMNVLEALENPAMLYDSGVK